MLRFLFGSTLSIATVLAQNGAYYAPQQPPSYYQPAPQYNPEPEPAVFLPPYPIIDPTYPNQVLSRYSSCITNKCDTLSEAYTSSGGAYSATNVQANIGTIAAYTSCATACAAAELLQTTTDFRTLLGLVFEIGFDQLRITREYLSGEADYGVIGNRTRIGESCCLPNEYFANWERIMVPVTLSQAQPGVILLQDDTAGTIANAAGTYMISAASYVSYCDGSPPSNSVYSNSHAPWISAMQCDDNLAQYLQFLQRNLGNLVLTPQCNYLARTGACSADLLANPRAVPFPADVCVAVASETGGKFQPLDNPLLKAVVPAANFADTCPPDEVTVNSNSIVIYYERVAQAQLKYWSVTSGLPDTSTDGNYANNIPASCTYAGGLATQTATFFGPPPSPSSSMISAAMKCPYSDMMEYCNMEQYASFLQSQLFDHSKCDVIDLESQTDDYPAFYQTVACLYKIFTLKCDCMQAVLNCYEHETQYSNTLSQSIGQAASILCGFILCQRPDVYSLFGGETAVEKAVLMRELLQATGLMSAEGWNPAMLAFVSFGLGMLAFVVTKRVLKGNKNTSEIKVEDGYQNLI